MPRRARQQFRADLPDGTGEWTMTFTADGIDFERSHGKAQMAARGSASDLLLLVWNRRPVRLETFGEPDLLEWWPKKVSI